MPDVKLLVVEDDGIIGRHIQLSLTRLGYAVVGVLLSGEEAVAQVSQLAPDLVLMDISLAGEMDGVQAAAIIREQNHLPVIFLTAFADQQTLQRAKITDPFGYLLKPFDERILQITIEMALYKYRLERRLVESEEMLRTLVENQGEGVAIVDPEGVFVFCNPALDAILAMPPGTTVGRNIHEFTDSTHWNQITNAIEKSQAGQRRVYELGFRRQNGEGRVLSVTATPWIDKSGKFEGLFSILSDITERKQMEISERRARDLAEALRDTAAALNSSLDIEHVYDLVLKHVGRVVPNEVANVMMIEGDQARIMRSWQVPDCGNHQMPPSQITWTDNPILRDLATGAQPLVFSNLEPAEMQGPAGMECARSYVGAPLGVKGRILGFINLGSSMPGYYEAHHASELGAFANQATLAIDNAHLFMETRKRANFLAMLNEITRLAINTVDEGQTIDTVAEKLTHLFKSDGAYITVWDEEQQVAIPAAGYGFGSEHYTQIQTQPGKLSLTASALRAGHPLVIENVRETRYLDPDLAATFPFRSMMGLPLIADGNRLGAVIIGYLDPHAFTSEEVENGNQVSSQVALAISKARLYSQVQRMAITDELTGLYNRRGIFELGRAMLTEALRTQNGMALIWLDIDHFKSVNDDHGHHIGDQVVAGVAACCQANVRDHDLIGRYGGEGGDELIVLLPGTDMEAARHVAERLRQKISSQPIDTEKGAIQITVSLGVSISSDQVSDLTVLLNQADQAMYMAKSSGRNCVVAVEDR